MSSTVAGRRVILWLFVALAVATAAALLLFSVTEMGRPFQARILMVLAGDLAIPVVAYFVLAGIGAAGRRRRTWWLLALPAGLLTYAVLALVALAFSGAGR